MYFFFRSGTRCIASVIRRPCYDDFDVQNEPVLGEYDGNEDIGREWLSHGSVLPAGYLGGSKERADLEIALDKISSTCEDVPIVIGTSEIRTKNVQYQVMPHNHKQKIAKFYYADKVHLRLIGRVNRACFESVSFCY